MRDSENSFFLRKTILSNFCIFHLEVYNFVKQRKKFFMYTFRILSDDEGEISFPVSCPYKKFFRETVKSECKRLI